MGVTHQAEVLCAGRAQGCVLRLDAPISFWGGVSPETSCVTLAGHPQEGQPIADRIVVIPRLIGSSSSSAVVLELIYKGLQPKAMILGERDAILPIGVLVAQHMGWSTVPVFLLQDPPFLSGDVVTLQDDGIITTI